jgi:hypothetical protein
MIIRPHVSFNALIVVLKLTFIPALESLLNNADAFAHRYSPIAARFGDTLIALETHELFSVGGTHEIVLIARPGKTLADLLMVALSIVLSCAEPG